MKTFEERKQEQIDACNIEYANRKFSWWKQRQKVYKPTLEVSPNLDSYIQTSTSIIVRKNFRIELLWLIGTVFFGVTFTLIIFPSGNLFIKIFIPLFFIGSFVYQIMRMIDRKPRIIFTEKDFWFHKMKGSVIWEYLIVTVIKTEQRGSNTFNSLLINYYETSSDNFTKIEFDYLNLEMELEDICFQIEKFKEKNIYNVRK